MDARPEPERLSVLGGGVLSLRAPATAAVVPLPFAAGARGSDATGVRLFGETGALDAVRVVLGEPPAGALGVATGTTDGADGAAPDGTAGTALDGAAGTAGTAPDGVAGTELDGAAGGVADVA
jgi:hypothetical protein